MRTSLTAHGIIALCALIGLLGVGWDAIRAQVQPFAASFTQPTLENMAIEHEQPASILLEYTTKSGSALLQIRQESTDETLFIHLPDTWERKEVRGAPVSAIGQGESTFESTKWPLSPGVQLQFWIPQAPQNILLHNPSGIGLKVSIIQFDFASNRLEQNVLLLQNDATTLW